MKQTTKEKKFNTHIKAVTEAKNSLEETLACLLYTSDAADE